MPHIFCACPENLLVVRDGDAAGVNSSVKEVQALALMTICKLVELAGAEQIRPQLPELVPPMLEALSGMEVGHQLQRDIPWIAERYYFLRVSPMHEYTYKWICSLGEKNCIVLSVNRADLE